MSKIYELPIIAIILFQEEIVRTSAAYGSDSDDDWGTDIWD